MNALFKTTIKSLRSVLRIFKKVRVDQRTASFIAHNRKVWRDYANNKAKGEILFEVNSMHSAIIAYSYLANILGKKYNAEIKAYVLRKQGRRDRYLSPAIHKVFKSFNTREILYVNLTQSQLKERDRLVNEVYPNLETKRDVEDLRVEGLWIGDLIYDSHLMGNKLPTVDINDLIFRESLSESLGIYVFWRDYFDSHVVKAVNVSHCVYNNAIILRLAIQRGIPAYQINATHAYYLTEKTLWAYNDFFDFPTEFRKLSPEEQRSGLLEAEKRLARRFAGEVGVDMSYSTKSAYVKKGNRRVLQESPRLKVFVALHCFFDSPHSYGVNLFPDFFEWLNFLGEISEKTDYDWCLKTHPDYLAGNDEIIEGFIAAYPKFTLLPSDTSHHRIIEDGIDFALTVYGTIGLEYAALGVPVINASLCNPHIAYNFNIHPKTVEEYENILMNLHDQELDIDVAEVYEYYYMKFINNTENWLFNNYRAFLDEIGGYKNQFTPLAYSVFLREFSEQKHERIIRSLSNYIESKEYCFRKRHACPSNAPI